MSRKHNWKSKKYKITVLFTLFLIAALIIFNILTEKNLQKDGWYSMAIMYFFSFSFFQIGVLEKTFNKGVKFVRAHLFLTAIKMLFSAMFIVVYGLIKGKEIDMLFFVWFLVLYLLYTALLGWLFYKRR